MSNDGILDDDDAREAISVILQRMDFGPGNLPGGWVLAYEISGIEAGEIAGNWGYLSQAGPGTATGLCHLTQDAITRTWRYED